jgi:hypothetical protein
MQQKNEVGLEVGTDPKAVRFRLADENYVD